MRTERMPRLERLFGALGAAIGLAAVVVATASAGPPAAVPGEPGCQGKDTANFAQDWKTFDFEPSGVGPLVRFYGGTNPADWLQSERYEDCAAP